jgi:hypothetical protein
MGVKRGCILRSTLFSLYINDLIDHFGPECEPLELKKKPISCLLYADDIILLSESAKGLQKSLDILKTYCDASFKNLLSDNTRVRIFIFIQNLTLGYMTKILNHIIFFSSTKIRIFFSATLGIRIFF